ncbi:MAG TPA: DUF3047 domain-containing protein [Methylomirabilota bacterium]|nr:DUF3047 domain-containing protein [Methylomirabilota bacterium]
MPADAASPVPAAAPAVVALGTGAASTQSGLAGAAARLRIPIADSMPPHLPVEAVPRGWALKEFSGRASVMLMQAEPGLVFRLRSERTSFALYHDSVIDLDEFPVLSWWWKVVQLPARGDVRHQATDDQAAQVYVVFPRWPSPRTKSDVIGYVWDTAAPVNTRLVSAKASNVRIIVVESGPSRLGTWRRGQRNVRDDYIALFGRRPPRAGSIALMIDTDDTQGTAETLIGDLGFSRS